MLHATGRRGRQAGSAGAELTGASGVTINAELPKEKEKPENVYIGE